jgi:hypothetical protein
MCVSHDGGCGDVGRMVSGLRKAELRRRKRVRPIIPFVVPRIVPRCQSGAASASRCRYWSCRGQSSRMCERVWSCAPQGHSCGSGMLKSR